MKFSISEAFKFSFQSFKENWTKILGVSFFTIVLITIAQYFIAKSLLMQFDVLSIITDSKTMLKFVFFKNISLIVPTIFFFCLTSTILPTISGSQVKFKDYFLEAEKVINFICGMFLIMLVPSLIALLSFGIFARYDDGSVLFNVFQTLYIVMSFGVIIYLFRYLLFYVDILEGQPVLKSLKNSAKMLKGNLFKFIALIILLVFISLLGILTIVGAFFVLPLDALVLVYVHMQLAKSYKDVPQKTFKMRSVKVNL
ncbi:MAG: hypothetical protein LBU10_03675 [Endomicrobium sp.]|jgi:hypothetical protein|nr:hypothetical protein [Endomicrobium sp.]